MRKKLFAKIGTTVGALLVSTVAVHANAGINSGFYAGASAGISSLTGKQDFTATNTVGGELDERHPRLSANSLGASVLAGYGHRQNCYWIAAEMFYLFDQLEAQQKARTGVYTDDKILKARSNGAWGGALHLGYIPSHANWMIYAIAGVEVRKFLMRFEDKVNPPDFTAKIDRNYNSVAFVPGVGIRLNLTKNVAFRGEYKYAFHRSKSAVESATGNGGAGIDTSTLKQSLGIHYFQLGVVYNF